MNDELQQIIKEFVTSEDSDSGHLFSRILHMIMSDSANESNNDKTTNDDTKIESKNVENSCCDKCTYDVVKELSSKLDHIFAYPFIDEMYVIVSDDDKYVLIANFIPDIHAELYDGEYIIMPGEQVDTNSYHVLAYKLYGGPTTKIGNVFIQSDR